MVSGGPLDGLINHSRRPIGESEHEETSGIIELSAADRRAVVEHAVAEYPRECCGLLVGKGRRVHRAYRLDNVDHSPASFTADPSELASILYATDKEGLDLVGIYHSHTGSAAYPSPTDVRLAYYPESSSVIVSLSDPKHPIVRSFRIYKEDFSSADGRIVEEEVMVL